MPETPYGQTTTPWGKRVSDLTAALAGQKPKPTQQINSLYDMFGVSLPNPFNFSRGLTPASPEAVRVSQVDPAMQSRGLILPSRDQDPDGTITGGPSLGSTPLPAQASPAGVWRKPITDAEGNTISYALMRGTEEIGYVDPEGKPVYYNAGDDPGLQADIYKYLLQYGNKGTATTYPPQFDWTKSQEGGEAALGASLDLQRLKNEGDRATLATSLDLQRLKNEGDQDKANSENEGARVVSEIGARRDVDVAKVNADATKTTAEKTVEVARINAASLQEATKAKAEVDRYVAELADAADQRRVAAETAIAEGNWALAQDQMQSAERISAAKMQVERESSALAAYTQLLGVESQERGRRAEAAASVFNTLAQLGPADQLRSAFYMMRGQAPPPSTVTQLPAGLMSALGVNSDTVNAAAQQLRGATTPPPWLMGLMGGKAA